MYLRQILIVLSGVMLYCQTEKIVKKHTGNANGISYIAEEVWIPTNSKENGYYPVLRVNREDGLMAEITVDDVSNALLDEDVAIALPCEEVLFMKEECFGRGIRGGVKFLYMGDSCNTLVAYVDLDVGKQVPRVFFVVNLIPTPKIYRAWSSASLSVSSGISSPWFNKNNPNPNKWHFGAYTESFSMIDYVTSELVLVRLAFSQAEGGQIVRLTKEDFNIPSNVQSISIENMKWLNFKHLSFDVKMSGEMSESGEEKIIKTVNIVYDVETLKLVKSSAKGFVKSKW